MHSYFILNFSFMHPGSIFSYTLAQDAAESPEMVHRLEAFVADLARAGFTRVSVIAHSMGARALLSFVGSSAWVKEVVANGSICVVSDRKLSKIVRSKKGYSIYPYAYPRNHNRNNTISFSGLKFAAVIFINPEVELALFQKATLASQRVFIK